MTNSKWQTISSKYVLENPWYKVRQDNVIRPDGKEGTYNVVECGESVFVVPVTSEGKILLEKLFRYTTQHEAWEIPAGGVEQGEKPLEAAKRELQEETGLVSEAWQEIGAFDSMNGMTDAVAHVFEAKGLAQTSHHEQEEEGITDVRAFSLEEIIAMILDGSIVDALSIAALMQFFASHKMITVKDK
jgi:8-oxo-dGTP pyrophosphatase MutT (NUDIX family)